MTKKTQELQFGQLPQVSGIKDYTSVKYNWSGLNKRNAIDTGYLSMEQNISTMETPYLTPSETPKCITSAAYTDKIALFAFEGILIVIYKSNSKVFLDYLVLDDDGEISETYTGLVTDSDEYSGTIRSMVQFNLYSSVNDVISGKYVKKLLLFPDKAAMYFNIINVTSVPTYSDDMDLNAMYCYKNGSTKRYYVWQTYDKLASGDKTETAKTNGGKFIPCGSANQFALDGLDVDVKQYYNDGHTKTNDSEVKSGKKYYTRDYNSQTTKYTYAEVTDIADGDIPSQKGWYEEVEYKDAYVKTADETYKKSSGKTYYKLNNDGDFEKVEFSDSDNGSSLKGLYEKIEDYYPPQGDRNKSYYFHNSFDDCTYKYVSDDGNGNNGWRVSAAPMFPNIKYAAVHQSRLFGVDDSRIYASGFNDYTNWNLDTVESNESNAWCSTAQSNSKADNVFTGITVYDNHAICFKKDYIHEIYNNKNPFRVVDVFPEGAIDNRSIVDVDGKLIFASRDGIKVYTGSNPKNISYPLNIDRFKTAVAGTDGRNYYLFCTALSKAYFFVYDVYAEQWSERAVWKNGNVDEDILYFAHNKQGMYALSDTGKIYKLDTQEYTSEWEFETDLSTALSSSKTVDIKHIRKIQLYVYIESGSSLKIYGLYDEEKFNTNSQLLFDSKGRSGQFPIRVRPRQTANYGFKLHFKGDGYIRIYSMEISKNSGGEVFKTGDALYE